MKNVYCYDTAIGKVGIAEEAGHITNIFFNVKNCSIQNMVILESPLLKKAAKQIEEYLQGDRKKFDLPLAPEGTDFQKRDWEALKMIPYGQTVSYGEIAEQIGCHRGARAVGMANNHNPIPIIIPCHRVIGSNGKLVGYAGGMDIKIKLLQIEGSFDGEK